MKAPRLDRWKCCSSVCSFICSQATLLKITLDWKYNISKKLYISKDGHFVKEFVELYLRVLFFSEISAKYILSKHLLAGFGNLYWNCKKKNFSYFIWFSYAESLVLQQVYYGPTAKYIFSCTSQRSGKVFTLSRFDFLIFSDFLSPLSFPVGYQGIFCTWSYIECV